MALGPDPPKASAGSGRRSAQVVQEEVEMSEMIDLGPAAGPVDPRRDEARRRVQERRGLQGSLVAYVVINAFLVGVWAVAGGGYFWPGWVLAGWGVAMVLGFWDYVRGPVTEADVDRELDRMR
jgi:hypothetical protein